LKEFTDSSTVYVGKVTRPNKKISEDADDQAHLDINAQQHILFTHADD
jgi:hypothetical protein